MKVLLHIADAVAARYGNAAGVGLLKTCQQAEQGGFAVAVTPDQPDALTPVDLEAGLIEKGLAAVAFGDIFRADHLCLFIP